MTLTMSAIRRRINKKRHRKNSLSDVKGFHRDQQGQAMTEFCITLPFLLFLVFGIIQLMLISNAQYILNLANFYALRTGVVHYERYQYGLESGNLSSQMKDQTEDVLKVVMPYKIAEPIHYGRVYLSINNNTKQDVDNINQNSRENWLQCQTSFLYPLQVPFVGNIMAHLFWLPASLNRGDWARTEMLGLDISSFASFDPIWPYIRLQTRNYDFSNERNPANSKDLLTYHAMAIQRRIYRNPGQQQPHE